MIALLPGLLRGLLLLCLALVPLPLAATRPLAEAGLGIFVALLMVLWAFSLDRQTSREIPLKRLWVPLIASGLVTLWLLIQFVPLPLALANPVWQDAARLISMPLPQATLSLDPGATEVSLMRLLMLVGIFGVTLQAARQHAFALQILNVLVISSVAYALYGLISYLNGNADLLGYEKWAYVDSLTGTHVNRNSFAAYCGMGLIASATLLLRFLKHQTHEGKLRAGDVLRRMKAKQWGLVLAIMTLASALLLTDSRGGALTTFCGLLALLAGTYVTQIIPRKLTVILLMAGLMMGGATYILFGQGLDERMTIVILEREDRPNIWRVTNKMIADYPITGIGSGAYETAYYIYRDDSLGRHFAHAHSAYLEWAAELGLPVLLIWLVVPGWVALQLMRGIKDRQQGVLYPLSALAILVQAASHSLFDFAFQINANAIILTMVLAMGVAQSYETGKSPKA